jgi:hypothetical protein
VTAMIGRSSSAEPAGGTAPSWDRLSPRTAPGRSGCRARLPAGIDRSRPEPWR